MRSERLASLDALRGFTMVWIIGADVLFHLLAAATDWAPLQVMSVQLRHVSWEGLHAYDLVFPVFMFVSGISLAFSRQASVTRGDPDRDFVMKALRRCAILILLGVVYNFGWDVSADRFRVASVLGQIGIAYLFSACILVRLPGLAAQTLTVLAILILVACLQLVFVVPGIGPGVITPEGTVNGWLDRNFLPGRLYGGSYDPEGILSVVSSAAVLLGGALVGRFALRSGLQERRRFAGGLIIAGSLFVVMGYAVSSFYPIVKAVWTVSFDLVAAGYSMLLFALFYLLIDVARFERLSYLLAPIGMNAIGIYMAARFLAYPVFSRVGPGSGIDDPLIGAGIVAAIILLEWLILNSCYRRRWILSV